MHKSALALFCLSPQKHENQSHRAHSDTRASKFSFRIISSQQRQSLSNTLQYSTVQYSTVQYTTDGGKNEKCQKSDPTKKPHTDTRTVEGKRRHHSRLADGQSDRQLCFSACFFKVSRTQRTGILQLYNTVL